MTRTIAGIIAAVVVFTATAAAQAKQQPTPNPKAKPSFSGQWVAVSPEKFAGRSQIVTQDATTLTIEQVAKDGTHKMTYQLDGLERRQAIPRGPDIAMLAKAAWDADRIVITTNISYPNGMKTQSKEVWSIDAQGRLVIDYTESGPTGPGDNTTVIYTKSK